MFTLRFNTSNASFGHTLQDRDHEIARTLRTLADVIEKGMDSGTVTDIDGNATGSWNCNAPESMAPGTMARWAGE